MARLKVGIVGTGMIADLHARGYEDDDRAEIVAVCDANEDQAIKHALDWGARAYFTDFTSMLETADLDAVEILTPHYLHAQQAAAALSAGRHVSVERPIGLSLEEADHVIAAQARSQKVLQIYEPCLYYKPLLDARNLIDAGEIGKPTNVRISATIGKSTEGVWDFDNLGQEAWRFDPKKVGGSPMLFDVGYQSFIIALFLVGSIDKVEVWQGETAAGQVKLDAPTVAMWKHFQQDTFGTLSLSYAPDRKMRSPYHPLEMVITIHGTRGDISVIRSSDPTQLESPVELRRSGRKVHYGQKGTAYEDSFVRATKNFIGACLGQEDPLLRGAEAKQLLVLTLAYYESVRRGRAISLQHG